MNNVNHPAHYNQGIETIEYIESHNMNFNIGNVVKYVTRAEYKGEELEDLNKALWYLQREIARKELQLELDELHEAFDNVATGLDYEDIELDINMIEGFIEDYITKSEYEDEVSPEERALFEEAVELLNDAKTTIYDEIEWLKDENARMRNVNRYLHDELLKAYNEENEDEKILY